MPIRRPKSKGTGLGSEATQTLRNEILMEISEKLDIVIGLLQPKPCEKIEAVDSKLIEQAEAIIEEAKQEKPVIIPKPKDAIIEQPKRKSRRGAK